LPNARYLLFWEAERACTSLAYRATTFQTNISQLWPQNTIGAKTK